MKSMQPAGYSQQFRAFGLAALMLIGASSAFGGDVRSGAPDVNKVFGRSSAIATQGSALKVAGLTVDAMGRSSNHIGKSGTSGIVATRSPDGLIAQYGRGTPSHTIAQKGTSPSNVAAKGR